METKISVFNEEELSEIQSLQIRGESGINPLNQTTCSDTECIMVYDKCTIFRGCSGPTDKKCSNVGCTIYVYPSDCQCNTGSES